MSDPLIFAAEEVEGSLPGRFARVAAIRASAPAIVQGSLHLTYQEVDRRSDALAVAIARSAPLDRAPVAILIADPVATILAVLATWKAGKLCVPLNPDHPPAYLGEIVGDTDAELVVTDARGAGAIATLAAATPRLRVDELDLRERAEPPRPAIRPGDPACLLYTSGSTGEPKGVVRSHRTLLYRAWCSLTSHGIGPDDRVSLLHSLSFSAGIRDLAAAFTAGAALLPWDVRSAGPRAFATWIEREKITVLGSGVSMIRPLLAEPGIAGCLDSVRVLHLGSEPLYRQDVERYRERFAPGCLLVAGYGSTEFSPITEHHIHHDTPLPAGRVPAGHRLVSAEPLVLDDDGQPVEAGQTGEIAVRSRYLSDGYWRRPDLTGARYRADPTDPAMRIYRTGDVGRLGPDGCLEVLGRMDEQVKVRGFRVNPGQVEAALIEHEGIRQAVVTARTGPTGDSRLVAYVVSATATPPLAGALRRFLLERLPAYLVPSAFVMLDAVPLNANAKVDRAALPAPPDRAPRPEPFVAPRTPLEHQIAEIWEALFGIAPIGADDDFFDLGGDSLLATALVTAIEDTCGRSLTPSVLLEAPTVGGLADALLREDRAFDEPLTVLRATGTRAPLFFVHNDHGRGLYTHALGRALHPDRPVYAIHLHGLNAQPLPDTVEAIAADRLRAVRAAVPRGPYVLGGHCFGGIVALEMARQLRATGERVEAVVMIDTPAPAWRARVLHRVSGLLGRVRGVSPTARAALVEGVDRAAEEVVGRTRSYRARLGDLARAGLRRQVVAAGRGVARLGRRVARLAGSGAGPASQPAPPQVATSAWQDYCRAIRRYVPASYEGAVTLFRARELPAVRPDLGWAPLLPGLEIEVVPGDHHSCVTRHVGAFASRLEARLQRAE